MPTTPKATTERVRITIVRGDTATVVAKKLMNAGLIDNETTFLKRLADLKLTGELLDGSYELAKGMELDTLIRNITVQK